jgi:hypothetical protein
MKIPRKMLERIIREELAGHIGGLLHEKEGKHPEIEDAEGNTSDEDETKPASNKQPDNTAGKPAGKKDAAPAPGKAPGDEEEKPVGDEPADNDLEKQATGEEGADEEDDEAGAEDTEKVSDELVGKTIQSISANPKSKLMPGAMEIVLQFDQIPEPLKILVTKSGQVKYYFKGLHNEI